MKASCPTNRRQFLRLYAAAAITTALSVACSSLAPTIPAPGRTPAATSAQPTSAAPSPTAPSQPRPAAVSTPQSAAPTGLTFWWGRTVDVEVNTMAAVLGKFEDKHPNVKVTATQPKGSGMMSEILAGGTPPDLFEWGSPAELALKGLVVPLDDLLSRSRAISKRTFLDASLKAGSWRGMLYSLPALDHFTELSTIANVELFQRNGLSVPEDVPTTFEDALQQSKRYTKIDQAGSIELLWFAFGHEMVGWLAAAHGLRSYDAENEAFRYDDPGWKDALGFGSSYWDLFGREKLGPFLQAHANYLGEPGCGTCKGRFAVFDYSYVATPQLTRTAPDWKFAYSWHFVPNSRRGKKVQVIGGTQVAIPTASKSRDEAWLLAEHLVSDESIKTFFDGCGFLLATKPLLANPDWLIDTKRYPGFEWHLNSLKGADELRGYVNCPIGEYAYNRWMQEWGAVIDKQKTIDTALSDLQKACTQELARVLKA